MIVECSNCQTRFRLDESRVPPSGIRVRCSRCKQTFFLQHPNASEAQATHDVVAEAVAAAAPESTQDLSHEPSVAASPGPSEPEEEEWEFNRDPPGEEPRESSHGVLTDPHAGEGVDARGGIGFEGDEDASDFGEASDFSAPVSIEDVGEPEDWDFFSDESLESVSPLEPLDDAMPVVEADVVPRMTHSGPGFAAVPSDSRSWLRGLRGPGRMLGWVVTVALCGLGIGWGIFPVAPAGSATATVVRLGDLEALEIRAVWLETARSTRLYVLHGRLLNDSGRVLRAGDGTQVALLSSQGARLEIPAARAGVPLNEEQLRMLSADALAEAARGAVAQLAGTHLEPGQAVGFQAFFDDVPDEATSFLVEMAERVPALESATTNPSPVAAR
ncbi:MAG: zinc-ribbon domain-containing protein [Myxococcota bacterium]